MEGKPTGGENPGVFKDLIQTLSLDSIEELKRVFANIDIEKTGSF